MNKLQPIKAEISRYFKSYRKLLEKNIEAIIQSELTDVLETQLSMVSLDSNEEQKEPVNLNSSISFMKSAIADMLSERLADNSAVKLWDETKQVRIELFQRAWKKVELKDHIFISGVSFEEWAEDGSTFKGMRKSNGRKHGITRRLAASAIEYCSYKDDKAHGLYMYWSKKLFLL